MKKLWSQFKQILLVLFVYGCVCLVMLLWTRAFIYIGLTWNLFLACLPYIFIEKAMRSEKKQSKGSWLFLWLLFFPNAVYPVTSFIHLSKKTFYWVEGEPPFDVVFYDTNLSDWLLLFVITIGFLVAYFIGFASLALFEKYLKQRFPRKWVYLIMLAVFELTSLAVLLGRFLRLNSWDIFLNSGQLLA